MNNKITTIMNVKENEIRVIRIGDVDYISLTDLARYADPNNSSDIIRNWMSNKNSFLFYSLWEELNNPNFNYVKLHRIKINEMPYNRFTMTPNRWKKEFNAIGIIPSSGKYSVGTFAHPDIAFEFATWLSPEFKLYLIKEFERLKKNELYQQKIEWRANRILTKANYLIQTDAIKNNIVPMLTEKQKRFIYAEEADVLNVALFGMTAKEWREANPNLSDKGNIRDYADLLHLIILNNLENTNAELIKMGIIQSERLVILNESARRQMEVLINNRNIKRLEILEKQVNSKEKILVESN